MPRFRTIALAAIAAASLAPTAARATPITFECDAPTERYSSMIVPIGSSASVVGTLTAAAFRPGKGQSIGGLVINSADGLNMVGFHLVLPTVDAKALNLVLVAKNAGKLDRRLVRTVPLGTAVPFSMVLPAGGQGRLVLGETAVSVAFANLKSGNAIIFCGSGQYRFTGLDVGAP